MVFLFCTKEGGAFWEFCTNDFLKELRHHTSHSKKYFKSKHEIYSKKYFKSKYDHFL